MYFKAVIISTSHSILSKPGETDGKLTGVFASELTVPYYEFINSGIEVDIASINGGEIPIDPESFFYAIKTKEDDKYLNDEILLKKGIGDKGGSPGSTGKTKSNTSGGVAWFYFGAEDHWQYKCPN